MLKIKHFISVITKFPSFLFSFLFLIIVLFTLKELFQEEIILESLNVPDEFVAIGYSGEVVAEKLLDEVRRIELETSNLADTIFFQDNTRFYNTVNFATNIQFVDIEIPGTEITYRSLVRYLRSIFGIKSTTYLRGDIIISGDKTILTLRNISDMTVPRILISTDSRNIEELIHDQGGKALIQMANPLLLSVKSFLNYSIIRLKGENEYHDALSDFENIIDYCLKHNPTNADVAFTLLGYAYIFDDDIEKSIFLFQSALKNNDRYIYAYLGLLEAYSKLKRISEAEAIFKKIFKLGFPNSEKIYSMMSIIYMEHQNYGKAFSLNEKAAKRAPYDYHVYLTWGINLTRAGLHTAAIKKFNKASMFKYDSPFIYIHWGQTLYFLEQYEDSIKMYKKALIFNKYLAPLLDSSITKAKSRMRNKCDDEVIKNLKRGDDDSFGIHCSKAIPRT